MADEIFVGRPDGLGNRMEEIYFLMVKHHQAGTQCEYLWNNLWSHRGDRCYPVLFHAPGIHITEMTQPVSGGISHGNLNKQYTQQQVFQAARKISPLFDIPSEDLAGVTGVHIRRGDKIKQNPPAHEMTDSQSKQAQHCALDYVNTHCDRVFVCGDDPVAVDAFKSSLRSDIQICEFTHTVMPEYFDYFCLTRCKEVVMASRYSSFAITASVLGNSVLHTFFDPEVYINDIHRYKAQVISHRKIQ